MMQDLVTVPVCLLAGGRTLKHKVRYHVLLEEPGSECTRRPCQAHFIPRSGAHFDPVSVCWECQMISHHCMWYSCQLKRYNEVLMKPDKVPKLKYNLDTILLTLVIDVSYCCLSPLLAS